jgi:sugar-specific transcriptional regulator TrmB
MNTKLLQDIGLTEGETKVYLALIKLGETKTGPLAKESGVSSSKVYKILDRLIKKGLAGSVVKGKTKYFNSMNPKSILDYMEGKQKELNEKTRLVKELIPSLNLERNKAKDQSQATLFEGMKAIQNFYRNILNDLKAGEEYYVLGAHYPPNRPDVRAFYYAYHSDRIKKKIKVNMLANPETRGNLEKTTQMNANIRYLPQYFISNMTITFYKNKAFIFFFTENPVGFLLESREVAKSLKAYFDVLWKLAKK